MPKYIFVTGGVCSSLGKGVAASSIGSLLESRGLTVRMIKIDPYINVDAGTMNPYQHGEVYVTDDGAETDLDLGNYARFTNAPLSKRNSLTTGQIYQEVIQREREGRFLGRCVQVIPHITDHIKKRIREIGDQAGVDVTIVEIGGTVGDIESIPFLEASRQFIHDVGRDKVLFVHLTLVPRVGRGEYKTKPTQHSAKALLELGIQPDILLCRAREPLSEALRNKIALFTNVPIEAVVSAYDVGPNIYEIPIVFADQKLDEIILKRLGLATDTRPDLAAWRTLAQTHRDASRVVKIGFVGKYLELHDSYKSVFEALFHGGLANSAHVELVKVDAEGLEKTRGTDERLDDVDGFLVPGGFGARGIEGMILAARYAREHRKPYFGICFGMHMMVIEYARSLLGLASANSTEIDPETPDPVVSLLEEQRQITRLGGTMRLGAMRTDLVEGTRIREIYGTPAINERHRHRYEVSDHYRGRLEQAGLIVSGLYAEESLVESVEWPDHPWGIGVQFHPEFRSRPIDVHPLFRSFIAACLAGHGG
jgi:CTP synthase